MHRRRVSAPRSGAILIRRALILLLVAGCATVEQRLDEAKATWQGASYEALVARWGAPERSTTLPDGSVVHTWISQDVPVYGGGPSVGVGVFGGSAGSGVGVGVGFPFGANVAPARCERTVTFRDNRVVEQSWLGDPGYCSHFRRPG